MYWQTARYRIDLERPRVMGIVNLTPDSFSDGGMHADAARAIRHCERLVQEGADILDLGAESTRPGAQALSEAQEWDRLAPVLPAALSLGVPVSVDTYKPGIMARALDLGADIVNDVQALSMPGAVDVVAAHPSCGVCLMHMVGHPDTMQSQAVYADVVQQVCDFLRARGQAVQARGVDASRIVIDPGIGFGKTPEHNLALLREQRKLLGVGHPVLLGWSRKSTLGWLTGRPVAERLPASLAAALLGVQAGARIVRVHDVAATVDVLKIWSAVDNPPTA